MSQKLFGTDGIRGLANHYPLDPETVLNIGISVATCFRGTDPRPEIVIGRDTRLSGNMLESALIAGITSTGVGVVHLGIIPTSFVSHMARTLPAIAGIMISASHNSFEDNGLKIFQSNGHKCDDTREQKLEELIRLPKDSVTRPSGPHLGKITAAHDAIMKYRELILRSWPKNLTLKGIRIALDTANGAAYETAPELLRFLGSELFLFHHEPNGININLDCGSTHPQFIQRNTTLCGAHVGFAFDGDADRLICCDEMGKIVDGDEIMAILALDLIRAGKLPENTLVATTQSNLGLDECIEEAGGKVIRTNVGDRHVMAALLEQDLGLGGEQSGHVILRHIMPTSDGLLTALHILRIMQQSNQPLSKLRQCLKKYPQVQINLAVREKKPLQEMPSVESALETARQTLGHRGRINFRYSGTESKARLLLEGSDENQLRVLGEQIVDTIRHQMKLSLLSLLLIGLALTHTMADPFADPAIKKIQDQHEQGVEGNKDAVVALIADLEKQTKEHPDNKLMLAYLGSAYTLRSRDLFPGPSKMRFLTLGIKTMDAAVAAAPNDLAVRFIRAINNYQLPAIFMRREIARTDFQTLLTTIHDPAVAETLNTDTKQAIYYYSGLAFKDNSDIVMARTAWDDGIKLAPSSPLGEKIAVELKKIKS